MSALQELNTVFKVAFRAAILGLIRGKNVGEASNTVIQGNIGMSKFNPIGSPRSPRRLGRFKRWMPVEIYFQPNLESEGGHTSTPVSLSTLLHLPLMTPERKRADNVYASSILRVFSIDEGDSHSCLLKTQSFSATIKVLVGIRYWYKWPPP